MVKYEEQNDTYSGSVVAEPCESYVRCSSGTHYIYEDDYPVPKDVVSRLLKEARSDYRAGRCLTTEQVLEYVNEQMGWT